MPTAARLPVMEAKASHFSKPNVGREGGLLCAVLHGALDRCLSSHGACAEEAAQKYAAKKGQLSSRIPHVVVLCILRMYGEWASKEKCAKKWAARNSPFASCCCSFLCFPSADDDRLRLVYMRGAQASGFPVKTGKKKNLRNKKSTLRFSRQRRGEKTFALGHAIQDC